MNYPQDTIRIQVWWFPVLFWNHQSQKGVLWSTQVFLVDCIDNEVRVSSVWKTRKGKGIFMDSQVPCYLHDGFNTHQTYSREVPLYLVLNRSSIFPLTQGSAMEHGSPSGLLSCLPKLWLMWLKTPLQNQNTMLLSAHKHSNLKRVGTNCLQNPESFGFSSYSQALLEFTASFVVIFIIISIIVLESILWEHRNYSFCKANTSKQFYLFFQY